MTNAELQAAYDLALHASASDIENDDKFARLVELENELFARGLIGC